ncbi:MAG: DUF420 domain-containing protein [Bacteroidota bacterium]
MNERTLKPVVWSVSVAIPIVIAILLSPSMPTLKLGFDSYLLPKINAVINSSVSLLLILGFVFIKQKKIAYHRASMLSAFVLSAFFLVFYVLYHLSTDGHTTHCADSPVSKGLYLFILISHIVLSVFIIPLASFSIFHALSEKFDKHRRLARITFPLWLYVSVTGVLVYLFISPCYVG